MLALLHCAHCWRVVLLIALLTGRQSLSRFTTATQRRRTRRAVAHFLDQDLGDSANLLRHHAMQTLWKLGWRVGQVKMVFSRRLSEGRWVALVTNQVDWHASTVVEHYQHRWTIEVFFKMAKTYWILGKH